MREKKKYSLEQNKELSGKGAIIMDNNERNHNQSSDSFYSYNNGTNQNGTSQNNGAYSANGAYQNGSAYGQNGGTYQNGGYQQQFYQSQGAGNAAYGQNPSGKKEKKRREKRERKPGGFGMKLAKCAALALVFGVVSGTVFEGVHLASGQIFGDSDSTVAATGSVLTQSDSNTKIEATGASSSYVASDVSDIVEAVMPSIVSITNVSESQYQSFFGGTQTQQSTSCGSGIIVSQDADNLYIATNNHVVEGADSLTVAFSDNTTVSAEIKGTDPSTDLAVIRVALSSIDSDTLNTIKVATLGNSDDLKAGQAAIAIGNALGYGQSVTTGVISALNREVTVSDSNSNTNYTAELIQTSAAINPGNSGGALLNAAGEVIGINSVKYADTSVEGIGYAIPISTAMPIIEDLITKEKVDEADSAYLGIVGVDVTSDVAKTYNMPTGVYVAQVKENSAAEQAGIQKGDIITAFDGKDVSSMEDLSSKLQYYKAGTTVDVTIQRSSNGQYEEQTLSVTLGKKN